MKQSRNVLISMGLRNENLQKELLCTYKKNGFEVYVSDAVDRDKIASYIQDNFGSDKPLDTFVYISPLPCNLSILDDDFNEKMNGLIHDDFKTGFQWLQEVARFTMTHKSSTSIVLIQHISSVVPTQRFSYCSTSQVALLNMSKVAAIEASKNGVNLRINALIAGWCEDNEEEQYFIDRLKDIHKGDSCPILVTVENKNIADACFALGELEGANGTTITIDGGYSVTRQIRKVNIR
jgi:NAD(P)-dependent dehydrogenase (short-subunit alcohol dehydrogenase family)